MADKKTLSPEEKKLAAEKHVDELVQKALVALEEMRFMHMKKLVVESLKTRRLRTCLLVSTL